MSEEIYPRVNFDGKCFSGMGKVGDDVEILVKGKIVSTREDEYGSCFGVEVYGVGGPGKDTKIVTPIVNEADAMLGKLAGMNPA